MSDITTQFISNRVQDQVVWPDPSPLASWWDSVMAAEITPAPMIHQSQR